MLSTGTLPMTIETNQFKKKTPSCIIPCQALVVLPDRDIHFSIKEQVAHPLVIRKLLTYFTIQIGQNHSPKHFKPYILLLICVFYLFKLACTDMPKTRMPG